MSTPTILTICSASSTLRHRASRGCVPNLLPDKSDPTGCGIFPQISGLGSSPMAQHFAISGLDEANSYLIHPVLGPRLRECTTLVNAVGGRTVGEIFDHPDDLKFHSSVTLFAWAVSHGPSRYSADNQVFADTLAKYFDGVLD